MSVKSALTAIGDKLRSLLGVTDKYSLSEMPSAIENVYGKGRSDGNVDGQAFGYSKGVEQGKLDEYNRFWDEYQQNGNRYQYSYSFAGPAWNDETLNPKYELKSPTSSAAINLNYAFYYNTGITRTPHIVSTANVTWSGTFTQAKNIKTLNISGVIGSNFDVRHLTQLEKSSFTTVRDCLLKSASGKTVTFSKTAKEANFTADEWTAFWSEYGNWEIGLA